MANATSLIYTGGAASLGSNITVTGGTGCTGTIRNSGTGLLTLSGALSKNSTTLTLAGGTNGITVSGVISGSANNSDLVIDGGTTTLTNANNTYNGPTFIINGATLNANAAGALPSSALSAVTINGSSTLALGTSQSVASLSGTGGSTVSLNANTLTINGSATTTYSGGISGTGNLVKNGSGTQTLAGATTFNGTTTVNSGILQAATANALANTSQVVLNSGGSFLVTADDAIGTNTDIELNGGTLAFGAAGYDGHVGALTLSANSTIDLGTSSNGVLLRFTNINWNNPNALLSIYNWTGNTEYSGNPGGGLDQVVIGNATTTALSTSQLQQIHFYSGIEQSSFIANAFQITSGTYNREIIAVPETETYFYAVALLAGVVIQYLRRRAKRKTLEGHRPA
jgi:autotransporter-associated beta strand protein